jgi:hypothetical protein
MTDQRTTIDYNINKKHFPQTPYYVRKALDHVDGILSGITDPCDFLIVVSEDMDMACLVGELHIDELGLPKTERSMVADSPSENNANGVRKSAFYQPCKSKLYL